MIDNLETLLELHRQGTMVKASSKLRITQSAVSKRIQALENHFGSKLIERNGRHVRLTTKGEELLIKVRPMLSELHSVLRSGVTDDENRRLIFGVSESILSSWGPKNLLPVLERFSIEVEFHAHRSPLILEKTLSGQFDVGLCSGQIRSEASLVSEALEPEPLMRIGRSGKKRHLAIEKSSATWKSIRKGLLETAPPIDMELQSFFSIARLVDSGFGYGYVPIGVAKTFNQMKAKRRGKDHKLSRPIQLVYRKTKLEIPWFCEFVDAIVQQKRIY